MRVVVAILLCLPLGIRAQQLRGSLNPILGLAGHWIVLLRNSGMAHHAIDSVQVNKRGEFRFRNKNLLAGYYRIGVGDDQVDIILNPIETEVSIHFDGRPLRDHVQVKVSMENERLWEYKYASRDTQAQSKRISGQRSIIDPRDAEALMRLTAEEDAVNMRLQATLDRLVAQDSASYFSKVIITDRKLMAALPEGPLAVRNAMDWIDPSLTRSAIYARAIMAILQSATPAVPDVLNTAADSVLHWASPDTMCWSFARPAHRGLYNIWARRGGAALG
ncbi:MAG: hypothetical protein IPJ85_04070 [Flavobacteriales bacterium]|nr:hypothetical protein [Flavobacteriales bacterium]